MTSTGTSMLVAEIDDSIVHLLATPVRRSSVIVTVFVMVSVATTRAIAVGLLYVLVWETLMSNFVSGVRLLSVSHYGLGIANGFVNDSELQAGLGVAMSVIMGVIVTALALALAVSLLSSFTLKGEPA